ncbi:MAG: bacillithiol biosynthesis cysteine-adding enzyme BshC [Acidobacteria bacterium]|nr:bacillithiol biosynthesis cysteine-adding enzyme BshC [Acidobacteriota bacterium]
MSHMSLPYSKVPKSSNLLQDYLYRYERLNQFYSGPPFDPQTYSRLANNLQSFSLPRKQIVEILLRQNRAVGASQETIENIRRLSDPDTFAVTTGQQVGLFSGPVFTLYKALTAVRVSQSLTSQGLKSVPVFWLATEDHDFEEVAHASAFDEEYALVGFDDAGERPAPHSPVGRVKLTNAITLQIDRLESVLPSSDFRRRLIEDLRAAYQPGDLWGQALARFMARLFGRWGVILLDPLDEAVHQLCIPIYQEALRCASKFHESLEDRTLEMVKAGYHVQVHIHNQSTLVFAERDGNRLPLRQHAVPNKKTFFTDASEVLSLADLEKEIENRPLAFSANVLLRPVVQDLLLPTLAYIAGPSELAYLGQAGVLYSAFKRPMPVIFPRAGFTLVDRRIERWLEKYRLSVEDVWQGEEHLSQRIAAVAFAEGWSERFDQAEQDLATLLERLRKDIEILDPTLIDTLKHAEEKIRYQVERLRGKMTRAALSRSEVLARQEHALLRALMPEKELQERMISGVYFLGRAGYELLERLLEQIPTDSSDHHILSYA